MLIGTIQRWYFVPIERNSPLAHALGLNDATIELLNPHACNAYQCPACGRETIYMQPIPSGVEINAQEHTMICALVIAKARAASYQCPACEIEWMDVAGYREGTATRAAYDAARRPHGQAGPSHPAVH